MENVIEIWSPRFHDMKVLIAHYHVKSGMNKIIFTKTWRDKVLLMEGEKIKTYPMESNGTVGCYAIPVDDFIKAPTGQLELI